MLMFVYSLLLLGAQLKAVCVEAGMIALRHDQSTIKVYRHQV